jgi:two-component system, chemotaxis family, chemotaxis protein CheY
MGCMTTMSMKPIMLNVLVVDDDEFAQEFATSFLRDLGVVTIATASDGKRALAAYDAARAKPNLIVCDLHMPGEDGFQLMDALGKRGYGGGILLVSGQEDRVLKSAGLMAEFHMLKILGTIQKPVTKEALSTALGRL